MIDLSYHLNKYIQHKHVWKLFEVSCTLQSPCITWIAIKSCSKFWCILVTTMNLKDRNWISKPAYCYYFVKKYLTELNLIIYSWLSISQIHGILNFLVSLTNVLVPWQTTKANSYSVSRTPNISNSFPISLRIWDIESQLYLHIHTYH